MILPALLVAEARVPATYYRASEVVIIRKIESAVLVTDRVLFRRSPFGINDAPEGIGRSAFVRMLPLVSLKNKSTPPLTRDAIKVTASKARLDQLTYINKQDQGKMVLGGYYLVEFLLDAYPPEVMQVEFTYKVDLPDSARTVLSFIPTFENSEHIPPVVWEELAAFRILIEGVVGDRVVVSQSGAKLSPVPAEIRPTGEPGQYWFRKDGEVVVTFK